MKNQKGFTLIELLAVIILLGALMLIIVPPLVSQMQGLRQDLSKSQISLIYSAAETYIKNNKNTFPSIEGTSYCFPLQTLVNEGLLDDHITDQLEDSEIPLSTTVKVTVDSQVSYSYDFNSKENVCTAP
ncbi:MAG: type II secretion system protein [Bacilli bacterium]|nr:type II secretion system protein [Bacilli bacterium]